MMTLILASNSPRRSQLLFLLGFDFRIVPANVDESAIPGETAADYVLRVAEAKAACVRDQQKTRSIIIAADTTVTYRSQILGKPGDEVEAEQMLRQLRDRIHQVYSGIVVACDGKMISDICVTDVPMRNYSDREIQAYIATGDPLDKAGAYAIQSEGFHPVEGLTGCFANVMGLPLCHLSKTLSALSVPHSEDVPSRCQEFNKYRCLIFGNFLSD
jgi:MAF protein